MNGMRRLIVIVPAVALAVLLAWLFWTRGTMEQLAFLRRSSGTQNQLVDQRPAQTASTLAGLAVSAEEQAFAQQAERLADHEVDQAFAQALRQAALQQRTASGAAVPLAARVAELKTMLQDDQKSVAALTEAAKASGVAASDGDDLDVAKAQLALDQDELTDSQADLARETGDRRAEIEQELSAREAALKKLGDSAKKESAVTAVKRYGTLWHRGEAWLDQRSRAALLQQARQQAQAESRSLAAEHDQVEKHAASFAARGGDGRARNTLDNTGLAGTGQASGTTRVARLERLSSYRVIMSILDDRGQAQAQLAEVYGRWETQVWLQHRIVAHLILQSLAWIAFILLAAALGAMASRALLHHVTTDSRRARTLDKILTLAINVLALGAVLLVVFGVPDQTPTILGLAGAGLTVVFQDFILAFFGWFVLMGRNGIRVCDWVEIDGVGGEVVEIGLFKTKVLETGNWTSRGHPTGRQVSFTNSFAIRGQYFNYSTHGQWMWDEITLSIPLTANAYELIERIQVVVAEVTTNDTQQAEREWQSATRQNALANFSAQPTVDLRPAASGVELLVRFVTPANDRFEMRRKLYEAVMKVMEGAAKPGEPASNTAPPA